MLDAHLHVAIYAVSYMQHYKLQDADCDTDDR
jgi:hypothetical protein